MTSTTMSGASKVIKSRSMDTPHCTAASGSRECSLSMTTVMPSGKTVRQSSPLHGIAERPKDRPFYRQAWRARSGAIATTSPRTIPFLQHDPDRHEDVMTDSEDHACDEWRYACMSRPWVPMKEAPKPENISGYRLYRMDAQPGDWRTY